MIKSEKSEKVISFCHNSSIKVNKPPLPLPPPKHHIDVKHGNLSMDVTPYSRKNKQAGLRISIFQEY